MNDYQNLIPIGLIFSFVFVYQLIFLLRFEFELLEHLNEHSIFFLHDFFNITTNKTNFFELNYALTNVKLIGFVLFSEFLYHFLISGFVLLLAMIAAIVLTLQKYFLNKTQNIYLQILKDYNTTVLTSS